MNKALTIIILIISSSIAIPADASNSEKHLGPDTVLNWGAKLITSFSSANDLDDTVPHYSSDSGHTSRLSLRESEIFFSIRHRNLTVETSVDFMGPGAQIVTAGLILELEKFNLYIGKFENLVATTEKTLFYDGYFTSGGIQTGARANQKQVQLQYLPKDNWTFSIAINDEKAEIGGLEQRPFDQDGPGTEASIRWEGNSNQLRLAGHLGTMKLNTGETFHPALLLLDGTITLNPNWRLYASIYAKQAGSQFMPADTLLDYVRTPEGTIREVKGNGYQIQVVHTAGNGEIWLAAGRYRVCASCVDNLMATDPAHVLVQNDRISAGICWPLSENQHLGAEYAWFITEHLSDHVRIQDTGSAFLLKWSWEF